MADFELVVHEAAFRNRKVRPIFNENLYGELLDTALESSEVAEIYTVPTVELKPHVSLGAVRAERFRLAMGSSYEYSRAGRYDSEASTIEVLCFPKLETTNRSLRHETKHWADDNAGVLESSGARMRSNTRKLLAGSIVLGAASTVGAGIFIDSGLVEPLVGIVWCVELGVAPQLSYLGSAHERAARRFMDDPTIKQRFDEIVRYEPI